MNQNKNIFNRIWEIVYPVAMYYAAISIGIFLAQLVFGTGNENYMICKIIGSIVALFVVRADYKRDMVMLGRWGEKEKFTRNDAISIAAIIGITAVLSVALNNIISMSPLVSMSEEYETASNAFYGSTIWLELLGSALITPVLEEMLHRGVVFRRLRGMMGKWSAIIVSALIFAALHFNIVQFIYAFLLGIVFAIFAEKTGKLYPAIVAHITANGIAVIRTETGFLDATVDGSVFAWVVSVILLIIGGIGLAYYYKTDSKENIK